MSLLKEQLEFFWNNRKGVINPIGKLKLKFLENSTLVTPDHSKMSSLLKARLKRKSFKYWGYR
jgi:hypothetical protein